MLEALCPSKTCFQLRLAIGSSLRSLARQGIRHMKFLEIAVAGSLCFAHFERSVKFDIGPLQGASSGSTD